LNVRDGAAELIREDIHKLAQIVRNQVNGEEAIEAIAADVTEDLHLLLRALETVGAATDPLVELDRRVLAIKGDYAFART
jgi:hypothetical protein